MKNGKSGNKTTNGPKNNGKSGKTNGLKKNGKSGKRRNVIGKANGVNATADGGKRRNSGSNRDSKTNSMNLSRKLFLKSLSKLLKSSEKMSKLTMKDLLH
jgi:hypothetical protein